MLIEIHNHGPEIVASNYWDGALAAAGKLYCTCNAGVIRVLVPPDHQLATDHHADYAICSRGPWPARGLAEAVELLLEDHSDSPYAVQLSPDSFDLLPAEPLPDRAWRLAIWTMHSGRPCRLADFACYWRRVNRLPCLQPWPQNR